MLAEQPNTTSSYDKVNYYRYPIQGCIKFNKPLILLGIYKGVCTKSNTKYTFSDIRPFVSSDYCTHRLTDHINISKSESNIDLTINIDNLIGERYILTCRPMIYTSKETGYDRGGLSLTDELSKYGFPGLIEYNYNLQNHIPYKMIIDFRKEFSNMYAWKSDSILQRWETDERLTPNYIYYNTEEQLSESKENYYNLKNLIYMLNAKRRKNKPKFVEKRFIKNKSNTAKTKLLYDKHCDELDYLYRLNLQNFIL